jgi:hypothetical protein
MNSMDKYNKVCQIVKDKGCKLITPKEEFKDFHTKSYIKVISK